MGYLAGTACRAADRSCVFVSADSVRLLGSPGLTSLQQLVEVALALLGLGALDLAGHQLVVDWTLYIAEDAIDVAPTVA